MFFSKFVFGDTAVYYVETPVEGHENKTVVGLALYPVGWDVQVEKLRLDSLVQVAFTGDEGLLDYTAGVTMTSRSSSVLSVVNQTATENGVVTRLTDGRGNDYTHNLYYHKDTGVFSSKVMYENNSGAPRTLEKLASLSLSGIFALSRGGNSTCGLNLVRMTSAWSRECRLKREPFSALGQEASWARYGVKCERWGQVGSMPNRGYYPFAAVEDTESETVWGVQSEAPYSWQMELVGEKESVTLTVGLADFEFGHWRKEIPASGTFTTGEAFFTLGKSLNGVCNALVHEADSRLSVPKSEEDVPVLFNEYCTTWGNPTEENIDKILSAVEGLPIGYFVVDCGWYKPEDKGWCNAIGDWRENKSYFPDGISSLVKKINARGMRAGIWFEFEIAGRDSDCFHKEELMLKRDGSVITCKNRRFLDLRKREVKEYLEEKFYSFLQKNGFGYLKIDYNDAYGIGCDGAESLGEGGRQVASESLACLDKLRERLPDLVIENCSSGGSRIEPLRMRKVSMCSFSDAHECAEIPLVAANVSRVVPARQMQIWAVLRSGESVRRTVYSLVAAMFGRVCLSGDVLDLSAEKKALIKEGLAFYEKIKDIVRYGDIEDVQCTVEYYREPFGYQIYRKSYGGRTLYLVHNLEGARTISLPVSGKVTAYTDGKYKSEGDTLVFHAEPFSAGAFLLESEGKI